VLWIAGTLAALLQYSMNMFSEGLLSFDSIPCYRQLFVTSLLEVTGDQFRVCCTETQVADKKGCCGSTIQPRKLP